MFSYWFVCFYIGLRVVLARSKTPMAQTMMTLVPEAYRNHPSLRQEYPEAESFYDFYAGMQEAWDGPALLVFSDGETVKLQHKPKQPQHVFCSL